MTAQTDTARPIIAVPALGAWLLHMLRWPLRADARFREARRFCDLPPELLRDMGLTETREASAFYSERGRRPADQAPVPIIPAW